MTQPPTPSVVARLLASVGKARARGLDWFLDRLSSEVRMPTSTTGRHLRHALAGAASGLRGAAAALARDPAAQRVRRSTLFFFYDLDIAPITFDICSSVALVEMERRRLGLAAVHAVLVRGRRLEHEPADYEAAVPAAARQARIDGILLPALRMLPGCTGITLCANRAEAAAIRFALARHVFPEGYSPQFPLGPDPTQVRRRARAGEAVFPVLEGPPAARERARRFLDCHLAGRRPVVITLREYAYMPGRNSRLEEWAAFADGLDSRRYGVVFVRDTEHALEPVPDWMARRAVCQAASFDLALRMALYEAAYLNMAVMHGPMELCWYNERCRYALFTEVGSAPQAEAERLVANGFEIGASLPFARPWQRWYWQADRLPAIERAFKEMCEIIARTSSATSVPAGSDPTSGGV